MTFDVEDLWEDLRLRLDGGGFDSSSEVSSIVPDAVEMVKAGLGISVMARWAVAPQIAAGTLCALPLTARGMHRQWSAAMIRHKATPRYVLRFTELLATYPISTEDNVRRRRHT